MGSETCICCGEEIPEGRQVCPICEAQAELGGNNGKKNRNIPDSPNFVKEWLRLLRL